MSVVPRHYGPPFLIAVGDRQISVCITSVDGQFDSEVLNPGDSFMLTFPEAGTFSYYCEIHPSMTGSVIVGAGGGEAAPMEQPAAPAGGGMGGY